jgi:TRAP-type C4-dicarboxylate transport system permease small subunit
MNRFCRICAAVLCLLCSGIVNLSACQGCKTSLVSSKEEAIKTEYSAMAYSVSVLAMLGTILSLLSCGAWWAGKTLRELEKIKRF